MRLSPFSLSATKMPSDTSGTPRARTSCARSRQHARLWSATRPLRVKLFMRHYTSIYTTNRDPNAAFSECGGWGVTLHFIADTRKLSPQARQLYRGIKFGRNGEII